MPVSLVWTPQAREDLVEIYAWIAQENLSAAENLWDGIQSKIVALNIHPRLGVRRSDIRPSARILIHGAYLVLYETVPDGDEGRIDRVEIVRIVDGRRNLKGLF